MNCTIPGLTLNPNTGQLAGAPTQAGQFCCTFRVEDVTGVTKNLPCCLDVLPALGECVLLQELFGDGSTWASTGLWAKGVVAPCIDCDVLLGGYAYYGNLPACDFDTGLRTKGDLTSPKVALPPGEMPGIVIEFDSFRHVENGSVNLDRTWLEVRFNAGGWQTVWARSAADPSPECEHVQIGKYMPQNATSFQLRFRFDSWDGLFNQLPGWAIDNVHVYSSACKPNVQLQSVAPTALGEPDSGLIELLNVPNPVRDVDTTRFCVRSPDVEVMRIQIFDLAQTLVYEEEVLGNELVWHTVDRHGEYLANGVYLYRALVRIGEEWIATSFQKLVILR